MMVRAMFAPLARAVGLYFLVESVAWFLITAGLVTTTLMDDRLVELYFSRPYLAASLAAGLLAPLVMLGGSLGLLLAAGRLDAFLNGLLPLDLDQMDHLLDQQESMLRNAIPLVGLICMALSIKPLIDGLIGCLFASPDWTIGLLPLLVAEGLVRVVASLYLLHQAPRLAYSLTRRARDLPRIEIPAPVSPEAPPAA